MIIKLVDYFGTGRAVPMLHLDDGTLVPGQIETKLESGSIKGRPVFTVTIAVDGKNVRSE